MVRGRGDKKVNCLNPKSPAQAPVDGQDKQDDQDFDIVNSAKYPSQQEQKAPQAQSPALAPGICFYPDYPVNPGYPDSDKKSLN